MLHHIQVFIKKFTLIIYLEINLEKKHIIIHGKLNQIILINLIDFNPNLMLPPMAKEWFTIWYYQMVINLKLNNSGWKALKIIIDDIKVEPIPWELNIEITLLNFCVGVCVAVHLPILWNKKVTQRKKFYRFLIPKFNLCIHRVERYERFSEPLKEAEFRPKPPHKNPNISKQLDHFRNQFYEQQQKDDERLQNRINELKDNLRKQIDDRNAQNN